MSESVVGICPNGCGTTLFLGAGGFVTCSFIGCPDPGAASKLLQQKHTIDLERRAKLLIEIPAELDRAYEKHGAAPWGRHEFYGILAEEFKELRDAIFADEPQERVLAEAVQVAAVVFRYYETPDRYRGPHPDDA